MMKKRKNEIKFFQFDVEKELDVYKKYVIMIKKVNIYYIQNGKII